MDGPADAQTDRQADRQTDRHPNRHTGRHRSHQTIRDDSVADCKDTKELLEDSRVGLLLPGAPHQP